MESFALDSKRDCVFLTVFSIVFHVVSVVFCPLAALYKICGKEEINKEISEPYGGS